MAQFPAVIELSGLNGTNGFRITGAANSDFSGRSVASAGDVNGDGFADLIIGADMADPNGSNSGASYVVFGKASGFAANLDLSSLDASNGFRLNGEAAGDHSGLSVASAGDVNGDGFADLIVGAYGADHNGVDSGASYVMFGKASGLGANIDLSSLDGNNGFRITGAALWDHSGASVASAGDVNGDGFADVIVGADLADPTGNYSGASYVVFGKASGFAANINLSGLNGSDGFRLSGQNAGDRSGRSVASAGDVNGDGFADLIVGAHYAHPNGTQSGASYVVFGKASGFTANINLSSLNGSDGFRLSGAATWDITGRSVASAGDVNGDGFADLIVGAFGADDNGASYVVFGKANGFAANINLSTLDGSNGFRINGAAVGDWSGLSVASAGDVNGDGFADLIIGATNADPNGYSSGASHVVFGKATGFAANLDLSSLNGSDGFRLNGVAANYASGASVASTGDVNGDGFADLIVGAPTADPNGANSGASYVVFGVAPTTAVVRTGTDISQTLAGGAMGDSLSGMGGNDSLFGHGGDDVVDGGLGDDRLKGGAGSDQLIGSGGNDALYGEADDDQLDGGTGDDHLEGGEGNDLLLGGIGNDHLDGSAGDDAIDGGAGGDFIDTGDGLNSVAAGLGNDIVVGGADSDELNGDGGNDILKGFGGHDVLSGGTGSDTLRGGDDSDELNGDGGNDTLMGGAHDDEMDGGTGVDTADYGLAASGVTVSLAITDAQNTGGEGIDTLFRIENLSGSSFADTLTGTGAANVLQGRDGDDALTGGGGSDTLDGGAGDDSLIGGSGADQLFGGTGADTYFIDNAGDVIIEGANGGEIDLVKSAITHTLGANLEKLVLLGTAATDCTGNGAANTLTGNGAANALSGLGGNDRLIGGGGNDILTGGAGRDTISGEAGADMFVYLDIADSGIAGTTRDLITDFAPGSDKIDLSAIDANAAGGGANDAFSFIGTAAFSNVSGQLRQFTVGASTMLAGDINGDSVADFQIQLAGALTLSASDFLL